MTKTIQTALAPLLIIGSFCNLTLFEYPLGQPRPYLTYLYILSTWSLFVYFFYYLIYNGHVPFAYYYSYFGATMIITGITSMLVSLFRFKELKMCLHKLSIVDDTLEALGTSKEYQRLRNWIIKIIIVWIVLSLLSDVSDGVFLNYDNFNIARLCVPFVGYYFVHVNNLSALIWGVVLRYISSRFQRVNECIHVLYSDILEDKANCTRRQSRFILINRRGTEAKERKQYMWIIMHVHLQLSLISRELNKIFSVQMSLQMTCYFMFIIEMSCEIYLIYIRKNAFTMTFKNILNNVIVYIAFTEYTIIIIILNYVCQTVYYKTDETIAILYKLSNNDVDEDFRDQILQFILQIKQREVKFGMGLLYLGYNFILQFYKTVVTVMVIIIQMGFTYEDIFSNAE